MAEAYINIGSNTGDRPGYISKAVDLIKESFRTGIKVSSPIVTEPWGFESDSLFINIGVTVTTELAPEHLLDLLQSIEQSIDTSPHRNPDGSYRDRRIDIDLIAVDTEIVDTPRLRLPHPRMEEREFVLRPMAELMPDWRHPLTGLTPLEMLARLNDSSPDSSDGKSAPTITTIYP